MELSKKTTILFSDLEHARLTALAAQRGVSMGWLVREACMVQYGAVDPAVRVSAVSRLTQLGLPVGTAREMKHESVVPPDALMP